MDKLITIDGPAASGKTSVSRELANKLDWKWVSTGAFYRGLAYVAKRMDLNLKDESALVELAESSVWSVELRDEQTGVLLEGNDVTMEIHTEAVGTAASQVSQFPRVRAALLEAQRGCFDSRLGLVAEGRDCGTVVFPKAPLKFYLTANSSLRASRRAVQHGEDLEGVIEVQKVRDQQDTQRTVAPLQIPEGAQVIDTNTLSLEAVVAEVYRYSQEHFSL